MRRWGVMRAAHHVAVQVLLEYLGIPALEPRGHGHAGVGEQLMAVEAEDFQPLAVQVEAAWLEPGLAETGPDTGSMCDRRCTVGWLCRQGRCDGIELRGVRRPQRQSCDANEVHRGG